MPEWSCNMRIVESVPAHIGAAIVFSALPSRVAHQLEPEFANQGIFVCSNASAYREAPDVPLLLPEVNPDHTRLLERQQRQRGWRGGIVTNPNCTSTGMTVSLKALNDAFGVRKVFAVSLQAVSGAGLPGVPSMQILDNVIPFISGEEEKFAWEPRKMLGSLVDNDIQLAPLVISTHTNRVAVSDGHIVCLSIELAEDVKPQAAQQALENYTAPKISRSLPSAPQPPIIVRSEQDRPQPRLDRMTGKGMTTVVGRLREDPIWHLRMVVLSHNTIRGAAGGSVYNAELLVEQGFIS
jgi:aspartate-semialdehyde dehydrogenase